MASSNVDLKGIPVLSTQHHYHDWAMAVQGQARLVGCWKAFTGTNTTSSTSPDATEQDHVEQREEKAIDLILRTISPNLQEDLLTRDFTLSTQSTATPAYTSTAVDYWKHLKTKFEKQDGISALLDYANLVNTKFMDDGTIEAQINALDTTRLRCALNNIKLEDWQYAAQLLIALPSDFCHIADSFLTTGKI